MMGIKNGGGCGVRQVGAIMVGWCRGWGWEGARGDVCVWSGGGGDFREVGG